MADATDMQENLTLYAEDFEADRKNREEALDDLQFIAGHQWDERDKLARDAAGRPTLTINRMPQFIRQVIGDLQQNKPAINVTPDGHGSDEDRATIYNGIVRNIQKRAQNTNPYITACEHAASCGIGHFRIVSEYLPGNPFHQELAIKPVYNPLSIVWDANAKAKDRSDARHCHSVATMTRKAFRKKYGKDAEMQSWDTLDDLTKLWAPTQDLVNVVEKFTITNEKTIYGLTQSGGVLDIENLPPMLKFNELTNTVFDAAGNQTPIVQMKPGDRNVVKWQRLSAAEELDRGIWVTGEIPIIPIIGGEIHFERQSHRSSLIRWAKDPQRLYNFWRSAQTEMISNAPKQPFIIGQSQAEGHASKWANANKGNEAALFYNDTKNTNPPQRQQPPTSSQGFQNEIGMAADDMKSTTGIYDAALGARSNETSGVAIRQRQQEADISTSHFSFNMAASLKRAGDIMVNAIPRIYDTQRIVRILGEDDTGKPVSINQLQIERGAVSVMNDLTQGRYDVAVNIGPSFGTRRQASLEMLQTMIAGNPELTMNFLDVIFELADVPNGEQIKKRARKIMPPGLVENNDTDNEQIDPMQKQMAEMQQKNADLEMRLKAAETSEKEAQAKRANAQADNEAVDTAMKKIALSEKAGMLPSGAAEIFRTIMATPADQITAPPPVQQPQPQAPNAFAG